MKKYLGAVLIVIGIFTFSVQQAHASFLGNIVHSIFGVKHSSLGAMASPTSTTVTSDSTTSAWTSSSTTTATSTPTKTTTSSTATSSATTAAAAAPNSTTPVTVTPSPVSNPVTSPVISAPISACKIKSFTATPSTITAGQSSTLAWTTSNCSYTGLTGLGNDYSANGSMTVTPSTTTTYGLTAFSSSGNQSVNTTVTVTGVAYTVTSPNGGEVFTAGQPMNVTWKSVGTLASGAQVLILMEQYNNGINGPVALSLGNFPANAGQATVTLPASLSSYGGGTQFGQHFKILIGPSNVNDDTPGTDFSDNPFTINPAATTLPVGCTSTAGYSQTTGAPCSGTPSTPVYPAGCTSSVGYSSTTGAPCGSGLAISRDVNDSSSHVVALQSTSPTFGITLATIDLTAQGGNPTVTTLPVHIAVTNSGTAGTNASSLITTLRLYNSNGVQIDSESVPAGTYPSIIFKNLNIAISSGSTQVFTIKGDANPINGTSIVGGASARIDVTANDSLSIGAGGTVGGNTIIFYLNGIQVLPSSAGGVATGSINPSTSATVLGFTVPFSVTAFGTSAYLPAIAAPATAASAMHGIQFCLDTSMGTCQAVGSGVIIYAGSDNLTVDSVGNYLIPAGQTKNFMLQVTYSTSVAGSYRAALINVNWNNTNSSSVYSTFPLTSNQFKTNYVTAAGPSSAGTTNKQPAI